MILEIVDCNLVGWESRTCGLCLVVYDNILLSACIAISSGLYFCDSRVAFTSGFQMAFDIYGDRQWPHPCSLPNLCCDGDYSQVQILAHHGFN